jgi:hypothetical protein
MGKILRILVVAVALAASAGATMRATDALPSESLVVTASSLCQKALHDQFTDVVPAAEGWQAIDVSTERRNDPR